MRERGGRTVPQVSSSEEAVVPTIRARIAQGTVVHADESPAWNPLHAKFPMRRINHKRTGSWIASNTDASRIRYGTNSLNNFSPVCNNK